MFIYVPFLPHISCLRPGIRSTIQQHSAAQVERLQKTSMNQQIREVHAQAVRRKFCQAYEDAAGGGLMWEQPVAEALWVFIGQHLDK